MLSTEEYEELTEQIRTLRESTDVSKWQIGDLIEAATADLPKASYREMLQRIATDTNIKRETVSQYVWVSKKFPNQEDREISPLLTYSHYRAVASVEDPIPLLQKAADEAWTVSALENYVYEEKLSQRVIDKSIKCSRSGCEDSLGNTVKQRTAINLFGKKFLFCSIACMYNFVHTCMAREQALMKGVDLPETVVDTPLLTPPDEKTSKEEWLAKRFDVEVKLVEGL